MKLKTPLVSVIIPVYKAHATLARSLNSIKAQKFDYDKIEIIISVDDGKSYDEFKKLFQNIKIINPSGKIMTGAGQARNRGIKKAKGKLIGFLDADDTWSPTYLKELAPIASRFGVAISKTEILNHLGEYILLLDPGLNIQIKHFGLLPGSFHPLVIKKFAGPFPDGPSQDVIHAIRLLKKIKYRYKLPLNAKYQLWLNNNSKTADKKFCKLVDNSYKNWRYYYLKKMDFERNSSNQEIIKTLQLKINWNNSYINSKNKKSFYSFLSEKF